jgi:hypothetical protein
LVLPDLHEAVSEALGEEDGVVLAAGVARVRRSVRKPHEEES